MYVCTELGSLATYREGVPYPRHSSEMARRQAVGGFDCPPVERIRASEWRRASTACSEELRRHYLLCRLEKSCATYFPSRAKFWTTDQTGQHYRAEMFAMFWTIGISGNRNRTSFAMDFTAIRVRRGQFFPIRAMCFVSCFAPVWPDRALPPKLWYVLSILSARSDLYGYTTLKYPI